MDLKRGQRLAGGPAAPVEPPSEVCTHLDKQASLCGVLTVPEQGVAAAAREVVVEPIEGLKVVLSPRPARHLPLKARIWNWIKEYRQNSRYNEHLSELKNVKKKRVKVVFFTCLTAVSSSLIQAAVT